ncbi:MAG TPA: family 78 glycoside hydrolase catalytic domain [Verrucomicrobiae bacterium]|nr:family 78 glycoside hydrolase catalytic domain [Verrucomicrobiae bacterium]
MKTLVCVFCLLFSLATFAAPMQVGQLTCEHLQNPVGIGFTQPRLSWKLHSTRAGEVQTAYQIQAASSPALLKNGRPDLWDSGKVISDQSVLVQWTGEPLASRSQVFWKVRVWDKDGQPSAWSDPASFELGLLNSASEWRGKWITADLPRYDIEQSVLENASWISAGSAANQAASVRSVVELPTNAVIRSAVMDVAADGFITIYINGQPIQQGTTSRTAPLHAEIAAQLAPGRNVIAISSAAVRNAARRDGSATGRNAIAAHGLIELENGQHLKFNTDGAWKSSLSATNDWFAPAFDDSIWPAATIVAPYSAQPSKYTDDTIGPGRYLRKEFTAKKSIATARLYATALGTYEVTINGRSIGDSLLNPGWTDYHKRVMVQTTDVTPLLVPGKNAIGVVLSDGWYAGRLGWMGLAQYGTRPVFAAQLEITYADGSTDTIATDESWKAGAGEIVGSDQQWGEIIDATKAANGWDKPSFNDSAWSNVVMEQHSIELDPQLGPPVRRLMELAPQKITRHGESWIVDFGQNMVGHVRLTARGTAGTAITVNHAEMLNTDGTLYTANLRVARSMDTFVLGGTGHETFEPHFTFHGFRYVEITGYPGHLSADDLRGVVVGSELPQTGTFECSNPDLNQLYRNIVWGQRGNFLSVPTDCPQRDERMGWMGDAQVFAPTAALNSDVAAFFTKWMVDVNDGQSANGDYSDISPRIARPQAGTPIWGDAGVIIPWTMYIAYGDIDFLVKNFSAMKHWVDFNYHRSFNWTVSGGVGDHLAPQHTPVEVVDTAYFANSAQIVTTAATLLSQWEHAHKSEDAARQYSKDAEAYSALHESIVGAFNEAFVATNGIVKGDTQTAYIVALRFNLLPQGVNWDAMRRLTDNVSTNGHLTTGFVGVGLICPTLTQIGRSDLAWELVLTNTYPSWLFSVKNGATTIWERWDGWTPEHGFQDPAMNSFNHYSLGSVGAWLYSGAAGIQADDAQPGYKHFMLQPQFTTRLSYVKASLDSPYGIISSYWHVKGKKMLYDVTIPPNTSAEVVLPVPAANVLQSGKPLADKSGVTTQISLVAGTYQFSFPRELIK